MTNSPGLPERREMRVSDADRDRVAAVLRDAAGEGRLDLEELDERLDLVYKAKTYGDLEPITSDLPNGDVAHDAPAAPPAAAGYRFGGTASSTTGIAIMGGFQRTGNWIVPAQFTAVAYWGGGEIDLREAQFSEREVTIHAVAIMGGIDITVPEDAEVHITGVGIMGGFEHRAAGAGAAGAPRIVISGLAFWGGVDVKRKPTKAEERRRKLEHREQRQLRREQRRLERGH